MARAWLRSFNFAPLRAATKFVSLAPRPPSTPRRRSQWPTRGPRSPPNRPPTANPSLDLLAYQFRSMSPALSEQRRHPADPATRHPPAQRDSDRQPHQAGGEEPPPNPDGYEPRPAAGQLHY